MGNSPAEPEVVETAPAVETAPHKNPYLATLLSFIWPGLGQAYRGERKRGVTQALPQILLVGGIVLAVIVLSPLVFAAYLFNPVVSIGLLIAVALLAVWRSWSIVDALGRRAPAPSVALAGVLIVAVGLTHVWVGYTLFAFYRTGQEITQPIVARPLDTPAPSSDQTPEPTQEPSSTLQPGPSATATAQPEALPGTDRRVTVLLVGVDNTHGEALALTDTLLLASYDPASQSLSMISIPRDTAHLPFYRGGIWLPRINSLMQFATRHPELYPEGSLQAVVDEVSYLVGVQIDYYAEIGIAGFTQLIDAVGGVDIVNTKQIDDNTYQFSPTDIGFHLAPGAYHLDGRLATAYARSRHGSTDYDRAARQQQIILALRAKLNDPTILGNLPSLLDAFGNIVRTNAPLDRLPELVSIIQASDAATTRNIVLGPPQYAGRVFSANGSATSMTQLKMDAIAQLSLDLFGADSLYTGQPLPSAAPSLSPSPAP